MKGYKTETLKAILAKYENAPVELLEELQGAEEEFGEGTFTQEDVDAKVSEEVATIKADYDKRFREAFFKGAEVKPDVVEPIRTVEPEVELSKGETITVDDLLKPATV